MIVFSTNHYRCLKDFRVNKEPKFALNNDEHFLVRQIMGRLRKRGELGVTFP